MSRMVLLNSLKESNLTDLARGAAFLGSGGGGDPTSFCLFAESCLQGGTPLPLKQLSDCDDDEMIVLVAGVGAPLVSSEKLISGHEWAQAIALVEHAVGRPIENVAAGEIGGANAFAAVMAAILAKKHLLDADSLGRAFPTLNISSCVLHTISPTPAVMVDSLGNAVTFHADTPDEFEKQARALVIKMGSSAMCALYPMSGKVAKKALIAGSFSACMMIGKLLHKSSSSRIAEDLSQVRPCRRLGGGIITHIEQEIEKGFLTGKIVIEGDKKFRIEFQNEFLVVFADDIPISSTPDILALLDKESLEPLGSDQVRYGLEVDILALSSPSIWRTKKGLHLTSPSAFGYDFEPILIEEAL